MIMSCTSVESESAKSTVIKNADSEKIISSLTYL